MMISSNDPHGNYEDEDADADADADEEEEEEEAEAEAVSRVGEKEQTVMYIGCMDQALNLSSESGEKEIIGSIIIY